MPEVLVTIGQKLAQGAAVCQPSAGLCRTDTHLCLELWLSSSPLPGEVTLLQHPRALPAPFSTASKMQSGLLDSQEDGGSHVWERYLYLGKSGKEEKKKQFEILFPGCFPPATPTHNHKALQIR